MEDNKTWSIVPLPPRKHSIECQWVYKVKYKQDGSIDQYKAQLVAPKGTLNKQGLISSILYPLLRSSPPFKFFFPLLLSAGGACFNWTSIMLFSMVICSRRCTWTCLSIIKTRGRIWFASCTNQYIVYDMLLGNDFVNFLAC